ncbi:MAG TPA: DUF2163 domain-containing protein [Chloroflexota bacterium]|nr:DUF2163 domain-containing protein [Chloroflexota bacterium]
MKTCSGPLSAHLAQGQTSLAYLWKVKRVDGTVLGFTTHDRNISYDSGDGDGVVVYEAFTGFTNSANAGKADLSVDNIEFTGFLESESLTDADIRAGLYDYATICVRIVNWADLTMGDVLIRSGTLGVVKMKAGMFTAEIRGLTHKLTTILCDLYGPVCRAMFGSGLNGIDMQSQWLCRIDVTAFAQTGSVNTVADATHLTPTAGLLQVGSPTPTNPAPAGWFNDGLITFTSGALDGDSFEIKSWDGTILTLFLPMPVAPAHSDTFSIEPGCNHTIFDCKKKYDNVVNFRGEPSEPGQDNILNYPGAVNS